MDWIGYVLMALSAVVTVATIIETPAIVPMFIVFWWVVLWGGQRLTRKRDEAEARRRQEADRGSMDS